jgi:hypothetical protein
MATCVCHCMYVSQSVNIQHGIHAQTSSSKARTERLHANIVVNRRKLSSSQCMEVSPVTIKPQANPARFSHLQVLGEAVAAHLKEQAKRTEAAKEGEQIGEVLAENVSEASGGLPSGEGSLGATKGGNEPPTASVETSTASAEASTFSAGSLASSHLSVPPKEGPTKSPFA